MSAIKITNKRIVKDSVKQMLKLINGLAEESDQVKIEAIKAVIELGNTPVTISNNMFYGDQ